MLQPVRLSLSKNIRSLKASPLCNFVDIFWNFQVCSVNKCMPRIFILPSLVLSAQFVSSHFQCEKNIILSRPPSYSGVGGLPSALLYPRVSTEGWAVSSLFSTGGHKWNSSCTLWNFRCSHRCLWFCAVPPFKTIHKIPLLGSLLTKFMPELMSISF